MTNISEIEIEYINNAALNSLGSLFLWEDTLYSGLSFSENEKLTELSDLGLLKDLEDNGLIPGITNTKFKFSSFDKIIEFKELKLVSSASEWSFDMIKAAGKCVLEINLIAIKYNYQLSKIGPGDIVFKGCLPFFIGLGTLRPIKDVRNNTMLEDFYRCFMYPLDLWNKVGYNEALTTYNEQKTNRDSAYDPTSFLASLCTKSENSLKKILKRNGNRQILTNKIVQETTLLLRNILDKTHRNSTQTDWGDYHDYFVYKNEFVATDRFKIIVNKINQLQVKTITELAGNWGLLSALILKNTAVKHVNCTDFDENAVNKMYNYFSTSEYKERLSPGLIDFMNPVQKLNTGNLPRRFKSEAVLALAVTHHLTLSDDYDLDTIFQNIAAYSYKYVFIEYMPLGLWNGVTTTKPTPESYNQEWFTNKFKQHFSILEISHLEENRILYIGEI